MDIKSIKNRADEVLMPYKTQFVRVLAIVLVLQIIPSLFEGDNLVGILSSILSIIFLPVTHGIIVSALKIVRNNGQSVNDEDGIVGFKRFGELFPTYIASSFVIFLVIFVFMFIAGIIIAAVFQGNVDSIANLATTGVSVEVIAQILLSHPANVTLMIVIVVCAMLLMFFVEAYLMAVPYLLEQYHITGFNAVKTSFKMIKAHIMDYIKWFFSFFGWIFLAGIIEGILSELISFGAVVTLLVGLFKIVTYLPRYYISQTVLFEEIAFYYFDQVGE